MQADAGEVWQDAERWSPRMGSLQARRASLVRSGLLDSLLPLFLSLVGRPRSGSKREEEEEEKQQKKKNEDKKERNTELVERRGVALVQILAQD